MAQFESTDSQILKKKRFINYLASLYKLPEDFNYNNYIELSNPKGIKSKEYIYFNMASYQDIKRYEFKILNSRYLMGYFDNNDHSICILTVSKTDSIQDSLKGYLYNNLELLLYNENEYKIAQYKPITYNNFSLTYKENKLKISYTFINKGYVNEFGDYSEGDFEFKIHKQFLEV